VSDGIGETVAIDEPTPSFVDGLWLHLQAAVSPLAEKRLASFARQRGVTNWIIATDFMHTRQVPPKRLLRFCHISRRPKARRNQQNAREATGS